MSFQKLILLICGAKQQVVNRARLSVSNALGKMTTLRLSLPKTYLALITIFVSVYCLK